MSLGIHWTCGSCNVPFDTEAELRNHRVETHPERIAGHAAYMSVIASGGTEEEAELAYAEAKRDHERNAASSAA